MKFRHPEGVRLAMTSGQITIVGPKWRELREEFHREALAKGCECDQKTIRTNAAKKQKKSDEGVTHLNEADKIRTGLIAMVTRNDEDDFTAAGVPNMDVLAKEVGFNVDRNEALEVWHQLEAEARAASESEKKD